MDPFSVLGIERRFDVDLAALERAHRELARATHPDNFAEGAPERRAAVARAADVNEALRVVRDPVRRAEAMLALAGVAVGEGAEPPAPAALLMAMMELGEEIAEARARKDEGELAALRVRIEGDIAECERALASLLADPVADRGATLARLGERRFQQRLLEQVERAEEELL